MWICLIIGEESECRLDCPSTQVLVVATDVHILSIPGLTTSIELDLEHSADDIGLIIMNNWHRNYQVNALVINVIESKVIKADVFTLHAAYKSY